MKLSYYNKNIWLQNPFDSEAVKLVMSETIIYCNFWVIN